MHETSTWSPGSIVVTAAADLDDRTDGLVAEDRARRHLGNVSLQDVEVGSADRRHVDADDRVRRVDDHRIRDLFPGPLAGAVVHERFHGGLLVALPDRRSASLS